MKLPESLKILVLEQKSRVDSGANTTGLITVATKDILADLTDVEPFITNRIEDICVLAPDWSKNFISRTSFPWIFSTDTPGLLGALAQKLGKNVTLETGARFEKWCRDPGKASSEDAYPVKVDFKKGDMALTAASRVLVGADGTRSAVAAAGSGLSRNKKILFAYEKALIGEPLLGDNPARTVYHLWFGSFSLGYGGWIAPNFIKGEKIIRVGYATYDTNIRAENKLDQMIAILKGKGCVKIYHEKPLIKYGGYFPVGGVLPKTAADNILLLGDAAGYCGAFSADGIKGALVSGLLAAKLIPRYLDGDRHSLGTLNALMETEAGLMSYYRRQIRYRFLWNRMHSNKTFTSLFELCEREKDSFLSQFCDAKEMRKSLLRVLLKPRHVPALTKLSVDILVDLLTGRR